MHDIQRKHQSIQHDAKNRLVSATLWALGQAAQDDLNFGPVTLDYLGYWESWVALPMVEWSLQFTPDVNANFLHAFQVCLRVSSVDVLPEQQRIGQPMLSAGWMRASNKATRTWRGCITNHNKPRHKKVPLAVFHLAVVSPEYCIHHCSSVLYSLDTFFLTLRLSAAPI